MIKHKIDSETSIDYGDNNDKKEISYRDENKIDYGNHEDVNLKNVNLEDIDLMDIDLQITYNNILLSLS